MTLDVNGIKECLNNLETNVSNFNSICDSIQNNTQEISNACDRLANFNDQIKEELSSYTDESNNEIHHIVRWKITGQDVLKNNIQTLNDSIANAIEITNKIHSKAERLIIKAENAGDKINDLERLTSIYGKDYVLNKLNSNFDTSKLTLNIARTSSDAANGNFIAEDKILKDFWTDETLKFEKGENGTYSIWQKDSNGNYQPMGWTDENTKKEYEKLNKQNLIGSGEYYQKDSEGTWKVNYDIATGNVISKDKFNNDSDEGSTMPGANRLFDPLGDAIASKGKAVSSKKTPAKSDNSESISQSYPDGSALVVEDDVQNFYNSEGKQITPITPLDIQLKCLGKSEDCKNLSTFVDLNKLDSKDSVQLVHQDGSVDIYYFDSSNSNALTNVITFNDSGKVKDLYPSVLQDYNISEKYKTEFSKISNLNKGNSILYLDANGKELYRTKAWWSNKK